MKRLWFVAVILLSMGVVASAQDTTLNGLTEVHSWSEDIYCVQWSPDGQHVGLLIDGYTWAVYNLNTSLTEPIWQITGDEFLSCQRFAYTVDGSQIIRADKKQLRRYDALTGEVLGTVIDNTDNDILQIEVSDDGNWLALSYSDNRGFGVWSLEHGVMRYEYRERPDRRALYPVQDFAFSPNGDKLVATTRWAIFVMNLENGDIQSLEARTHPSYAFFTPVGTRFGVASPTNGNFTLWDTVTWEQVGGDIHSGGHDIDPQGRYLAIGTPEDLILYDATTVEPVLSFGTDAKNVAFHPDGDVLLSADWDGNITAWGMPSGDMLGQMNLDEGYLIGMDFSPNGAYLVATSQNRITHLWAVDAQALSGS
jgi:WD40 repeat protein